MSFTIYEEHVNDRYYIKIDSDHDSTLSGAQLASINLIEGFRYSTPFFVLKFVDFYGDLVNHTYISPSSTYNIYLGEDPETAEKSQFSLGSLGFENINGGKPEEIGIVANFITDKWQSWISNHYSRSWTDVFISDVVAEIAEEIGMTPEVESTKKNQNIIQPYWTNHQLVKWLSKRALNQNNVGGYQLLATLDDRLIFKPLDSFYNQSPVKELTFGDGSVEDTFKSMDVKQNYSDRISQGAGGINYMWFDYLTKQWKTGDARIDTNTNRQITDWTFVAQDNNTANQFRYYGRDDNAYYNAGTRINEVADSMMTMNIAVLGDITLHTGDLVNLIIPASQFSKKVLNTFYSGYWMISKVNHQITVDQNKLFVTHLELVRNGLNGTNFTEFARTATGRKIR